VDQESGHLHLAHIVESCQPAPSPHYSATCYSLLDSMNSGFQGQVDVQVVMTPLQERQGHALPDVNMHYDHTLQP